MDKQKPPEDILDEILNRPSAPGPSPISYPPEFDPPPPEDIPLPPLKTPQGKTPEGQGNAELSAKVLPWLCIVLGAALLVMGVCLLQVVRVNDRLDELQEAVENVAEIDRLREENENLQTTLQAALDEQAKIREKRDVLEEEFYDTITQLNIATVRKQRAEYLWYIQQFMDNGDYPMAALAVVLSTRGLFPDKYTVDSQEVYLNPGQTAQYRGYCQELASKGYLQLDEDGWAEFAQAWDPNYNPDMAALGIVWCAAAGFYVENNVDMAAFYLINYQYVHLDREDGGAYPQRVREFTQADAIALYEQLIHDLVDDGILVEDNGALDYAPDGFHTDILYSLPFVPPFVYLYGDPNYGGADQTN